MKFSTVLVALATAVEAKKSTGPTVYMIRHGEKPASGDGLSAAGLQRAQCLRSVFGASSAYDIGYIMAMTPKADGKRQRPLDTVAPLAADLGLTVDTSCDRDDAKCVKKAVKAYASASASASTSASGCTGNILICWEHSELTAIAEKLGARDVADYPDDSYDLIWTDPYDYSAISNITSENCPGLDD